MCVYIYIYIQIYTHTYTRTFTCVISGFRLEVNKSCALLGCYAASGGNFLPTFNLSRNVALEDGTDRLPESRP